jgi:cobalamin-dependent methionine synthase I
MIIVGELINSSRTAVKDAIERRDRAVIEKLAVDQQAAGADYIDVNAGVFGGEEAQHLKWLVETVQAVVGLPCCIDSPDPYAMEAALAVHRGTPLINSISLEKDRYEALLPLLAGSDFKVVALCMSDDGMPETAGQRLAVADKLIQGLTGSGVALANIHVDPLVQPVATNGAYGREFLAAIELIMAGFPGVHTMCGLSNISFGLPNRKLLNRTFVSMAVARGLDGAIVDPLDTRMIAAIRAAEAIIGQDAYCQAFIKAHRAGVLEAV